MTDKPDRSEHESGLPGFLGTIDSLLSRVESFALAAGVLLMATIRPGSEANRSDRKSVV